MLFVCRCPYLGIELRFQALGDVRLSLAHIGLPCCVKGSRDLPARHRAIGRHIPALMECESPCVDSPEEAAAACGAVCRPPWPALLAVGHTYKQHA